jgi:hypothetical protein
MFYIILSLIILLFIILQFNSYEYFSNPYIINASYCDNFGKCIPQNLVRAIFQYYSHVVKSINISNKTFGDPSPDNPKYSTFTFYDANGKLIKQKLPENTFFSF